MILDFHTHFYTEAYLDALDKGWGVAKIERTLASQRQIVFAGDYSLVLPEHSQVDRVAQSMTRHQVDHQLLGFSVPGLHIEKVAVASDMAMAINDNYAEIVAERPDHFSALAALPLQDPEKAAIELERAVKMGLVGGQLFSNVNGQSLAEQRFWTIYETAARLDIPLFIHPISPASIVDMEKHRLVPMAGFMFDVTIAALNLIFEGVMARFPTLKIVLGNLGGTLPFLASRIDQAYKSFPETHKSLDTLPSIYLRRMYLETAGTTDPEALQMAINLVGVERVLLGTDFPQQLADVNSSINLIENLPLDTEQKQAIKGMNAARLLGLAS